MFKNSIKKTWRKILHKIKCKDFIMEKVWNKRNHCSTKQAATSIALYLNVLLKDWHTFGKAFCF